MKVVKGDLIKLVKGGHFDVIVQGCNCQNTMGKGIAKQIKAEFPEAYEADCKTISGDKSKLGSFSHADIFREDGTYFVVINAYTQYDYRPTYVDDGISRVNYDAIRQVFKVINFMFKPINFRIGYPKIGCGLAGGDWDIVSKIIDEELEGCDHTLVEFDQ